MRNKQYTPKKSSSRFHPLKKSIKPEFALRYPAGIAEITSSNVIEESDGSFTYPLNYVLNGSPKSYAIAINQSDHVNEGVDGLTLTSVSRLIAPDDGSAPHPPYLAYVVAWFQAAHAVETSNWRGTLNSKS